MNIYEFITPSDPITMDTNVQVSNSAQIAQSPKPLADVAGYYVSTEFKESNPEDYKLNRLLIVECEKVKVCDAGSHTVAEVQLNWEVKDIMKRLYRKIDLNEFVQRFFNLQVGSNIG